MEFVDDSHQIAPDYHLTQVRNLQYLHNILSKYAEFFS